MTLKVEKDDFIELEYDLFANDKLVQTTNEKKGKEANLNVKEYGPQTIIVGKEFILKSFDEELVKNKDVSKESTIELPVDKAFGKRKKELIKVMPKSAFDEHRQRPVVGMVYDFNGMYGTVKSVIGGRVMVDFNNPLANKDVKIVYKVTKKIEDVKDKLDYVIEQILKIPNNMFSVEVKEKDVILGLPDELAPIKDMITKSLGEYVKEMKDYSVKIDKFTKEVTKNKVIFFSEIVS